jgi:hypothetical protein
MSINSLSAGDISGKKQNNFQKAATAFFGFLTFASGFLFIPVYKGIQVINKTINEEYLEGIQMTPGYKRMFLQFFLINFFEKNPALESSFSKEKKTFLLSFLLKNMRDLLDPSSKFVKENINNKSKKLFGDTFKNIEMNVENLEKFLNNGNIKATNIELERLSADQECLSVFRCLSNQSSIAIQKCVENLNIDNCMAHFNVLTLNKNIIEKIYDQMKESEKLEEGFVFKDSPKIIQNFVINNIELLLDIEHKSYGFTINIDKGFKTDILKIIPKIQKEFNLLMSDKDEKINNKIQIFIQSEIQNILKYEKDEIKNKNYLKQLDGEKTKKITKKINRLIWPALRCSLPRFKGLLENYCKKYNIPEVVKIKEGIIIIDEKDPLIKTLTLLNYYDKKHTCKISFVLQQKKIPESLYTKTTYNDKAINHIEKNYTNELILDAFINSLEVKSSRFMTLSQIKKFIKENGFYMEKITEMWPVEIIKKTINVSENLINKDNNKISSEKTRYNSLLLLIPFNKAFIVKDDLIYNNSELIVNENLKPISKKHVKKLKGLFSFSPDKNNIFYENLLSVIIKLTYFDTFKYDSKQNLPRYKS